MVWLTLLGAVSACDAPSRGKDPISLVAQVKAPAPALSKQQVDGLSGRCEKKSREQFRRAWQDGVVNTADGKMTAEFTNHYNAELDTCFYLLTVTSASTLKKMLFDMNGGELYGEYWVR